MAAGLNWFTPDWPAPPDIHAAVTLRHGGTSTGPYASFNLAAHVGDDPAAVAENRRRLRETLALPSEPAWLEQVHGTDLVHLPQPPSRPPCADGSYTATAGVVCAVLTADCLPVLITDGLIVAAVHAGWRGLAAGILERALTEIPWGRPPMVWLGPAIGPAAFEVGPEVRDAFLTRHPELDTAFFPRQDRFLADLYQIATYQLYRHDLYAVFGGHECTFSASGRYFSHRRDGTCGRQAALIWRSA
ncbi:polyphenol oxidase [Methylomarinovum tepidoasis]|uniref:Purine nucleoside phosphorylase n=1 Tax=Methylomarinovum tepidoasis TaxID=2840183 RepID=A0AAU9BYL4_9GAMM|nr:peptidoglycan editing factor PgeF [Methylomarinovum sp. IN45]BCX88633.1 polyphenol oxidase [Methylomarinovum sp. IN45]